MANEKTKRRIFHLPAFFIGHNAKKENARKVFLSYTGKFHHDSSVRSRSAAALISS